MRLPVDRAQTPSATMTVVRQEPELSVGALPQATPQPIATAFTMTGSGSDRAERTAREEGLLGEKTPDVQ